MNTKNKIEKSARRTLAKMIFLLMTSRMYSKRELQRIESTFQSSTGRDIYIVQFIIYSFTRFNHLLYIAIYYI